MREYVSDLKREETSTGIHYYRLVDSDVVYPQYQLVTSPASASSFHFLL